MVIFYYGIVYSQVSEVFDKYHETHIFENSISFDCIHGFIFILLIFLSYIFIYIMNKRELFFVNL